MKCADCDYRLTCIFLEDGEHTCVGFTPEELQ
jgi:hypothetical protein